MVHPGIGSPVNAAETEFEKSLSGFSVAALLERGFRVRAGLVGRAATMVVYGLYPVCTGQGAYNGK